MSINDELNENQDHAIQHFLCAFVRSNRWLSKATPSYNNLMQWYGDHIIFNIDHLSLHYLDKHVEPYFIGYCTAYLAKFVPEFHQFLIRIKAELPSVTIVCKYDGQTFSCTFSFPLKKVPRLYKVLYPS